MFRKRAVSILVCVLPLSLPLLAACNAPSAESAEGPNPGEGSVGVVKQALVTSKISIAGDRGASLALRSDGTVSTSGDNPGDGTTTAKTSPVQVSGLAGVTAVAAGTGVGDVDDSLALQSDGKVFAWGANDRGQLGDGTTTNRAAPVQVSGSGLGTAYTAVAAGTTSYSLGISSEGTVLAWGSNDWGQLGDGSGMDQSTPVKVSGLVTSGVTAVAAAEHHAVALKPDGTVWNWGFNGYGELGLGVVGGASSTPVQVSGLSGVTAVAAAASFTVALKSDGTVWAWGDNTHGELGMGTSGGHYPTPVQVLGLSGITAVAAGRDEFALALKSDGTVFAWGSNGWGQLGDGTTTERYTPVQVSGLSGVTAITAGRYHALAQKSDGTVVGWGGNFAGQLGDGTVISRTTPVLTRFNGGADCSDCASWPMPNPVSTGLANPTSYTVNAGSVVDNVTGLTWQQSLGCSTGCTQADATAYCAGLTLAGYSDWRLPTRLELVSIVDDTQHAPAIDRSAFPGPASGYLWASTPMVFFPHSANAFRVGSSEGDTAYGMVSGLGPVRCVRAPGAAPASQYVIQAGGTPTGTVVDTGTWLTWQQSVSSTTYTLNDAISYCNSNTPGLPGTGWRLPSMKELQTLVDDSRVVPAINPSAFPSTPIDAPYWTATPVSWQPGYAWNVLFNIGQSTHDSVGNTHHVRCVR